VRARTGFGLRLPLHVRDADEGGVEMATGTVKWFSNDKSLAEGARVEYEVEEGPKGLQARGVRVATSV
jgi:hypothetical protein